MPDSLDAERLKDIEPGNDAQRRAVFAALADEGEVEGKLTTEQQKIIKGMQSVAVSGTNSLGQRVPSVYDMQQNGREGFYDRADGHGNVFERGVPGLVAKGENGKFYAFRGNEVYEVQNFQPRPGARAADRAIAQAEYDAHPAIVRQAIERGVSVLQESLTDADRKALANAVKRGFVRKVLDYSFPTPKARWQADMAYIQTLIDAGVLEPDGAKEFTQGPLTVIKQVDGSYRWVLTSSNSFEDRDREIVSQRALEADVARADATKEYGPLRWWHLKGLEIGDCDFNMLHGRMLVESGTFRDWRYAVAVKERAAELGVSIGFEYPRDEPDSAGVFYNIRRYERSLLPLEYASNPFTSVSLVKESSMTTQAEKIKAFAEFMRVDESTGLKMLEAAESAEKAALDANARHKEAPEVDPCVQKHLDAGKSEDEAKALCAADKPAATEEKQAAAEPSMSKKEFDAALTAIVGELEKVRGELHILTTASAEKSARDTDALTAVKALAEQAQAGVLELKGELPRRLGDPLAAYRPSTHGKTPTEDKIKQATPEHDPWAKHMEALIPSNNPFVPPGN